MADVPSTSSIQERVRNTCSKRLFRLHERGTFQAIQRVGSLAAFVEGGSRRRCWPPTTSGPRGSRRRARLSCSAERYSKSPIIPAQQAAPRVSPLRSRTVAPAGRRARCRAPAAAASQAPPPLPAVRGHGRCNASCGVVHGIKPGRRRVAAVRRAVARGFAVTRTVDGERNADQGEDGI